MADLEALKAGVKALAAQIADFIVAIAGLLRSDALSYARESVDADEKTVIGAITDPTIPLAARQELAKAVFQVMVREFPRTSTGLNHLATVGLAVGALRMMGDESPSTGVVWAPVTMPDSKWARKAVAAVHGYDEVASALRAFATEVEASEKLVREAETVALREGVTQTFLEILEQGGEAVLFVPSYKSGDKWRPSGHIRVRVEGGRIFPVAATSRLSYMTRTVRDADLHVTVSSLRHERLELPFFLEPHLYGALCGFHAALRAGYECELRAKLAAEEREERQAKTTVSVFDFVLRGAVGIAEIRLDEWSINDRLFESIVFLAERDEEGAIRVVEGPEEIFPADSENRILANPGEKFEGLKYPLGAMLRVLFSKLSSVERRRNKSVA
ncbi:MAG: hypothetical protein KBC26_03015 [Candidatus Pacebacteria bacterium]|nr:hypothetical protein [Candidatus Paceibacterota bacterium]